ncbi:MAG TPA: hypothetical protein VMV46_02330, partial [Thermoanaerobaculia bacterium]|nr:hypothetical protein [Thermoanaerobaculia bacterium]
ERRRDEPGAPRLDEVRARHAAWYLTLAGEAEPGLASARRGPWVRRLRLEGDNLRASLRFAIDRGEAERALRAMGSLAWAWYHLGQLSEGRHWLEQALALPGGDGDRAARSRALTGAARLARYQDDFIAGRSWAEEAVALARSGSSERDLAFALNALGLNAQPQSDPIALSAASEGVALMRSAGDDWGLALCVFYLGTFAFFLGGGEGLVRESLDESAKLFRGLDDRWGLAGALFYLGWLEQREGNRHGAHDLLEESVELLRLEGDKWRTAFALRRLAEVQDDALRAKRLRAEAHALEETLGIHEAFTPAPTAGTE